jgi:general secretion pathway protein K
MSPVIPTSSMSTCRSNTRRPRGSALLTVLWLTAALSAIGLALANNVRGETERAATAMDDTRAYFIARGAIERAALHIEWGRFYRTPDDQPMYFRYGSPSIDLDFPAASARVEVIPEASKLPLNQAPPQELFALLTALGQPENRALAIAGAIIDWRTPVTPERPSAFDAIYLSNSPSFLPRHASFQENEELLLVQGITSDLYYGTSLDGGASGGHSALRDCVSTFGSSSVDVNTARRETMIAVGVPPSDADAIIQRRRRLPFLDPQEFTQLQNSLGPAGMRLRIGGNTMYTLRATVRLKSGGGALSAMRRSAAALVKFNFPGNYAGKPPGFEVLRWYDRF